MKTGGNAISRQVFLESTPLRNSDDKQMINRTGPGRFLWQNDLRDTHKKLTTKKGALSPHFIPVR
jgi:hypothetical protein